LPTPRTGTALRTGRRDTTSFHSCCCGALRLAKVIDTGSVSLQSGQVNRDIPTRTAASRRYFYRIPEREGVPPNWMEGFFSRVEGHAAPLLKRLIAGDLQLTDPERATLSFFFAIQMQRTPVAASQIRGVANAVFQAWAGTRFTNKELFAADYREVFGDASEEEIEEFREKVARDVREGRVEVTDPGGAAFGQGLLVAPYQSWIIFEADWTVMVCANAFVTSDRGFAIHDPAPPFPWTTQSLLSSPLSETTLPLDKSTCLMIRIGAGRIVLADVSHQEAMAQNLRLYGWADEYIFGQSQEVVVKVRQAAKATPAAASGKNLSTTSCYSTLIRKTTPWSERINSAGGHRGFSTRALSTTTWSCRTTRARRFTLVLMLSSRREHGRSSASATRYLCQEDFERSQFTLRMCARARMRSERANAANAYAARCRARGSPPARQLRGGSRSSPSRRRSRMEAGST